MPARDGTGPYGLGPLTGRGLGPCGRGLRRGYGFGYGYGFRAFLSEKERRDILEAELKRIEEEKKYIEQELQRLKSEKQD